jgi:hypothetical protein
MFNFKFRLSFYWLRLLSLAFLFISFHHLETLAQKTIMGKVINGTTGQPAPKVKVELLDLSQGMQTALEAETASDGTFKLTSNSAGEPQILIRVIYLNVNYNLAIPPGSADPVEIKVFEVTADPRPIKVTLPVMLTQASANALLVQQQYIVDNQSNPPRTFLNPAGTFWFDTPDSKSVQDLNVSVVGLAGVPLPQHPEPRKAGGYSLSYPMKPGKSEVRISYQVNSPSNRRHFQHRLFYEIGSSQLLVLPADMKVTGAGLTPLGNDPQTGASAFQVSSLSLKAPMEAQIEGEAPVISTGGGENSDSSSSADNGRMVRIPNRIYQKREIILGSLGVFFALVILFAFRQTISIAKEMASRKIK